MDYNQANVFIGKVRTYENSAGEIVSNDGTYLFTEDSISSNEEISLNDMVLFRGEEIHGIKKAFFIRKLEPTIDLNDQVYQKTKGLKQSKKND